MGCNCGKGRRDSGAAAKAAVAGSTYSVVNARGSLLYRTQNKSLAIARKNATPGSTCTDQNGKPC